ncbi:hypothetical protein Ahy_A08g038100 [Arachis hypogaea]|uniref:SWIM-type domain-containing protein n=1 Tax=Arachis hypogaea TaxID=3818 RepID=A0A445BST4_ARAHY|nr:hypothetical protein Ahy_A08g038100 [Arachis hypogaea]
MMGTYWVDILDALKTIMLRILGGVGTKEVRRIAYRFLYALPNIAGDGLSPPGPKVVPLEVTPIYYTQPHDSADDSDNEGDSTYVVGSESSSDTGGQIHSQRLLTAIDKNRENLLMLRVTHCDHRASVFSVEEMEPVDGWSQTSYRICLSERTCDCGLFQSLHYPCRHTLAACAAASIEWGHFVDPVYTMASVFKPNPAMRRKASGRSVSTRIQNEMDAIKRAEKRCGLCRGEGHIRRGCPNAPHLDP